MNWIFIGSLFVWLSKVNAFSTINLVINVFRNIHAIRVTKSLLNLFRCENHALEKNQHFTQATTHREKSDRVQELKQFLLTEANQKYKLKPIIGCRDGSHFFSLVVLMQQHTKNHTNFRLAGIQLKQNWDFRNSFIFTRLTEWQCVHCSRRSHNIQTHTHCLGARLLLFSCFVSHSSQANVINIHDIQRDYSNVQTNLSQICIFHM